MDDIVLMRVVQRLANLCEDRQHALPIKQRRSGMIEQAA